MRQRTTFFHHNEDAIDRAALKIKDRTITGPEIKAAREDRFTLGLEELPSELQQLLRDSHELHLRWSPATAYDAIGPWSSRLSPGLHIFYTPKNNDSTTDPSDPICTFLRSAISIENCSQSLVSKPPLPPACRCCSPSSLTLTTM
jgi:hypothetical protein